MFLCAGFVEECIQSPEYQVIHHVHMVKANIFALCIYAFAMWNVIKLHNTLASVNDTLTKDLCV